MDKNKGKYALPCFIICAVLLFMPGAASAADRDIVVLGTATPGGGFPVYGAAFAEAVNHSDTTLMIEPRNTKGSTENVPLLEAGKLDIALVQGEVAYALFNRGGKPAGLRIIAAMYSSPGMFAVKASSPSPRFPANRSGSPATPSPSPSASSSATLTTPSRSISWMARMLAWGVR